MREKSPEQALSSLMALCARAERSSGDALRLMTRWGIDPAAQGAILEQLRRERFIDDRRYAGAYIREKTRLNGWGVYKIRAELSRKGVAREIIDDELSTLDSETMSNRLEEMLSKRALKVKFETHYQLRDKLLRYGASLGYNFSKVQDCVERVVAEQKEKKM